MAADWHNTLAVAVQAAPLAAEDWRNKQVVAAPQELLRPQYHTLVAQEAALVNKPEDSSPEYLPEYSLVAELQRALAHNWRRSAHHPD